jgi:RNA polymerase sigma-70 factor (ECF subfamily)
VQYRDPWRILEKNGGTVKERLVSILPKMQRFAHTLTGSRDDADNLVQRACERFLRTPETPDKVARLENWMYRVIHNAWVDENRSMPTKYPDPLETDGEIAGKGGGHSVSEPPNLTRVRLEMARLPVEQRAVLMLVCVDGLSYQEAAGVLCIPAGVLASRLSRARLALAEKLRQSNDGEAPQADGKTG